MLKRFIVHIHTVTTKFKHNVNFWHEVTLVPNNFRLLKLFI